MGRGRRDGCPGSPPWWRQLQGRYAPLPPPPPHACTARHRARIVTGAIRCRGVRGPLAALTPRTKCSASEKMSGMRKGCWCSRLAMRPSTSSTSSLPQLPASSSVSAVAADEGRAELRAAHRGTRSHVCSAAAHMCAASPRMACILCMRGRMCPKEAAMGPGPHAAQCCMCMGCILAYGRPLLACCRTAPRHGQPIKAAVYRSNLPAPGRRGAEEGTQPADSVVDVTRGEGLEQSPVALIFHHQPAVGLRDRYRRRRDGPLRLLSSAQGGLSGSGGRGQRGPQFQRVNQQQFRASASCPRLAAAARGRRTMASAREGRELPRDGSRVLLRPRLACARDLYWDGGAEMGVATAAAALPAAVSCSCGAAALMLASGLAEVRHLDGGGREVAGGPCPQQERMTAVMLSRQGRVSFVVDCCGRPRPAGFASAPRGFRGLAPGATWAARAQWC